MEKAEEIKKAKEITYACGHKWAANEMFDEPSVSPEKCPACLVSDTIISRQEEAEKAIEAAWRRGDRVAAEEIQAKLENPQWCPTYSPSRDPRAQRIIDHNVAMAFCRRMSRFATA